MSARALRSTGSLSSLGSGNASGRPRQGGKKKGKGKGEKGRRRSPFPRPTPWGLLLSDHCYPAGPSPSTETKEKEKEKKGNRRHRTFSATHPRWPLNGLASSEETGGGRGGEKGEKERLDVGHRRVPSPSKRGDCAPCPHPSGGVMLPSTLHTLETSWEEVKEKGRKKKRSRKTPSIFGPPLKRV